MDLPLHPPVAPMLAKLARTLPLGDYLYEPKWDGFRCLVFRDADELALQSRNENALTPYFPELVAAFAALPATRFVLDGEIVVAGPRGLDFTALLQRIHPAQSRIDHLRREHPASFIAFDVLAVGDEDVRDAPFAQRRARLDELLGRALPPLFITPCTDDPEDAAAWLDLHGAGIEGVVVKERDLRYEPGKRAMLKVKQERTADCVVAGFRWHGNVRAVGSLLLGLYTAEGELRHVGIAASFPATQRVELLADVLPYVTSIEDHPWEHGFGLEVSPVGRLRGAASRWQPGHELTWVPLRPELVCEVAYDQLQGDRFRHPPKFRHWRPDRDARSCTFAQFPGPVGDLADVFAPNE